MVINHGWELVVLNAAPTFTQKAERYPLTPIGMKIILALRARLAAKMKDREGLVRIVHQHLYNDSVCEPNIYDIADAILRWMEE